MIPNYQGEPTLCLRDQCLKQVLMERWLVFRTPLLLELESTRFRASLVKSGRNYNDSEITFGVWTLYTSSFQTSVKRMIQLVEIKCFNSDNQCIFESHTWWELRLLRSVSLWGWIIVWKHPMKNFKYFLLSFGPFG